MPGNKKSFLVLCLPLARILPYYLPSVTCPEMFCQPFFFFSSWFVPPVGITFMENLGKFFQQKASCNRVALLPWNFSRILPGLIWDQYLAFTRKWHMGSPVFLLIQRPRQATWNLVCGVRARGGMVEQLLSKWVLYLQPLNVFTTWLCQKHEKKGHMHKHVCKNVTVWVCACMHTRTWSVGVWVSEMTAYWQIYPQYPTRKQ